MNTKARRKTDSGKMEIEMECTWRFIKKTSDKGDIRLMSVLGCGLDMDILLLTMYRSRLKERLLGDFPLRKQKNLNIFPLGQPTLPPVMNTLWPVCKQIMVYFEFNLVMISMCLFFMMSLSFYNLGIFNENSQQKDKIKKWRYFVIINQCCFGWFHNFLLAQMMKFKRCSNVETMMHHFSLRPVHPVLKAFVTKFFAHKWCGGGIIQKKGRIFDKILFRWCKHYLALSSL